MTAERLSNARRPKETAACALVYAEAHELPSASRNEGGDRRAGCCPSRACAGARTGWASKRCRVSPVSSSAGGAATRDIDSPWRHVPPEISERGRTERGRPEEAVRRTVMIP